MCGRYKVKVITFGCQMNVYDSQRIVEHLAPLGYTQTEDEKAADLIVVNTCSVREKPAQKVYSLLGRLKKLKASKPRLILAVAGCVAQQEQREMASRVPYVDIVMGPDHICEVAELVELVAREGGQIVATSPETEPERIFPKARPERSLAVSAFVTIMKGCDQYCSYCIVPYTRGHEISKERQAVIDEVRHLLDKGVKEVTLLGQNVNRYGLDSKGRLPTFPELLAEIHELRGLTRLKFVTSHPADCGDDLIDCFTTLPKLCSYFHLPIQSGSDRILSLMNRRYDYAHYRNRIERLRAVRPGTHISTDIIVGFPGESDADFEATMEAAREIRWGSAFSFKYSPRPGTQAALLKDDVPMQVKESRLAALQAELISSMERTLQEHVGTVQEVLVEGQSVRGRKGTAPRQFFGRTGTNYIVNFESPLLTSPSVGDIVKLKVVKAYSHSLWGETTDRGDKQ